MVSHETLPLLQIQGVSKSFGITHVLSDISLTVQRGDVVSLLGPSGSGKSTLLRCVAGLETVDKGRVVLEGQDITNTPTHQRGIGMMFQQFALFPHRSVADNIAFGLRMQGATKQAQQQRIDELLELIGLQGYGQRSIFELSGGEQQRVALARSLAPRPRLLLLDEPLSSLDQSLRERLMNEVRNIIKQVGVTALYVTHSQEEAFAVSDQIVVLDKGQMLQQGTPEQIYAQPVNRFVAGFLGIENILPINNTPEKVDNYQWWVPTPLKMLLVQSKNAPQPYIAIRSEKVEIVDNRKDTVEKSANLLTGVVVARSFRGRYYEVRVEYKGGIRMMWEVEKSPQIGDNLTVYIPPTAISFIAS